MDLETLTDDEVRKAFSALSSGRFAKEALPAVLKELANGSDVDKAIGSLGLGSLDQGDAADIIDIIIHDRAEFVREKGEAAVGPLMGVAMKELRGKLDGKKAADLLKERVQAFLKG